jgi:hypothetical protein
VLLILIRRRGQFEKEKRRGFDDEETRMMRGNWDKKERSERLENDE